MTFTLSSRTIKPEHKVSALMAMNAWYSGADAKAWNNQRVVPDLIEKSGRGEFWKSGYDGKALEETIPAEWKL